MDGLHKKSLVVDYIQLMIEGKSLDKIVAQLKINKKTAFDGIIRSCHPFEQYSGKTLKGIVESDEIFEKDFVKVISN